MMAKIYGKKGQLLYGNWSPADGYPVLGISESEWHEIAYTQPPADDFDIAYMDVTKLSDTTKQYTVSAINSASGMAIQPHELWLDLNVDTSKVDAALKELKPKMEETTLNLSNFWDTKPVAKVAANDQGTTGLWQSQFYCGASHDPAYQKYMQEKLAHQLADFVTTRIMDGRKYLVTTEIKTELDMQLGYQCVGTLLLVLANPVDCNIGEYVDYLALHDVDYYGHKFELKLLGFLNGEPTSAWCRIS